MTDYQFNTLRANHWETQGIGYLIVSILLFELTELHVLAWGFLIYSIITFVGTIVFLFAAKLAKKWAGE